MIGVDTIDAMGGLLDSLTLMRVLLLVFLGKFNGTATGDTTNGGCDKITGSSAGEPPCGSRIGGLDHFSTTHTNKTGTATMMLNFCLPDRQA